jgi:Fic family protein
LYFQFLFIDILEAISEDISSDTPWIKFEPVNLSQAPPKLWILLGEARSKCDHLGSIALQPQVAEVLHFVYLAKGAAATTAIEGNTLTEEQVRQRVEGRLHLPPSQEYLGKEIDNIVTATNEIWKQVRSQEFQDAQLTSVREICLYNRTVLQGTQYADYVSPGHIRESVPVGVGGYQGAPAEDCRYLLEQYCTWLNRWDVAEGPDSGVIPTIVKAIAAHLMFEWIHPFGDGNGRVGRLIEFKILVAGGIPTVAAHLLSNPSALTRSDPEVLG